MKRSKLWLEPWILFSSSVFLVSVLGVTSAQAQDQQKCLIVLDASNSMSGYKKGKFKMDIAKEAIGDLVATLPDNIDLGLVVYGHRKKSDCNDIELMIPVSPVNRSAFMQTVNGIRPNGKTPLTNSIEFAANAIDTSGQGASIILFTDGLETCRRDPCEAVAALMSTGIKLTAHVIAFDLSDNQSKQIQCIADLTGGQFLAADDAAGLSDAFNVAITAVASGPVMQPQNMAQAIPTPSQSSAVLSNSSVDSLPVPPPTVLVEPEPEIVEFPITLTIPESVAAGSDFLVGWEGPSTQGDTITIVPDWAEEGTWGNREYVRDDNPLTLTSLIDPQEAEVRYVSAQTNEILGKAAITITKAEATVSGPEEAVEGNTVKVTWTGPANDGDFISIVPKDAEPGTYLKYKYTERGTPEVKVVGLLTAGPGEIRYITGQGRRTLARADINFTEALAKLTAPEEAVAGSSVPITWEGPANQGDFISIVPADAEEGKYLKYAYAKKGENSIKVTAPMSAGDGEVRYITAGDRQTLARIPINIVEAQVTLSAAAEAVAGSKVKINWEGPGNQGDFITIVPKETEDSKYLKYGYAKSGQDTVEVIAPMKAGPAEIRYLAGSGRQILARIDVEITEALVELNAPSEVVAGSNVRVEWVGPANQGDFITIVPKETAERAYGKLAYARKGEEAVNLLTPMETGEAEIRYVAAIDRRTLGRIPVTIIDAKIVLNTVSEATVGNNIRVGWEGPANKGDFITLVNKSAAEGYNGRVIYATKGKPVINFTAPMIPGQVEVRYIAGASRETLGRTTITLEEARVGLEPPEKATPNANILIEWTGPQNENDYLSIVPKGSPDNQRGITAYTAQGSPARIRTPNDPGNYEVRYISGQEKMILGRADIEIVASQ